MRLKRILPIIFVAILLLVFQNCSKLAFESLPLSSMSGPALVLENGRQATNKKILSAQFVNIKREIKKFRIAEVSQFNSSLSWLPYSDQTTVDLNKAFAADGSKDNTVVVQAELSYDDQGTSTDILKAEILLDTIPPVAYSAGILSNGPDKDYAFGESIALNWSSFDIAALSGTMSGFGPDALSLGYSRTNSCDGNVVWIKQNTANNNSYSDFPWQGKTPLDTFYICMILQDRAGNSVSLLSQPMTRLWKVIAGDNTQGNGGSAQAYNVRFNYPHNLAVGPTNNIYVFDTAYRNIREIDSSGKIRLLAGNPMKPVQEGSALDSNLPVPGSGSMAMAVDSQDRIYFFGSGSVWRISNNDSFFSVPQLTQLTGNLGWSAALAVDRATNTLFIGNIGDWGTGNNSYILKIPIAELETSSKPDLATLVSKYKFAGNGTIPTSFDFTNLDLAASAPVASSFGAVVGENGEFYYSTWRLNSGPGAYQVRLIKADANGVLHNYLLAQNLSYVYDLEFVKTASEKFLLIGNSSGVAFKIDVKNCTLGAAMCPVTVAYNQLGSASAMKAINDSQGNLTYVTASPYESKVLIRDAQFKKVLSFGRDVYNPADNESLATAAMINSPHEVLEDKRNNIIIFENRSNIFRSITPDGNIHLLAGTPFSTSNMTRGATYDLSTAKFNNAGGRSLSYDAANDALYYGGYSQPVAKIDLANRTASLYGPGSSTAANDPNNWYIDSLFMNSMGVGKDPEIYVSRFWDYANGNRTVVVKYTGAGGLTSQILFGDPTKASTSSLTPGMTTANASMGRIGEIAMDSTKNIYYSDAAIFGIDANNTFQRVSPLSYMPFTTIDTPSNKYFVGVQYGIAVSDSSGAVKQLCFPGSFLNAASSPTIDHEGNLLFVDENNSRVIKYNLMNAGQLDFVMQNDARCPK